MKNRILIWLRPLLTAVASVFLVLVQPGSAHALALSLQGPPAITSIGQSVLVALNVTGVKGSDGGGTLRGYDIVIDFDPGVLSLTSGNITLNLAPFGGSPSVVIDSSVLGGDSASLTVFVSLLTLNDALLRSQQTDAFQLAQLSFTTVIVPVLTTISIGVTDVLTGLDGFSDPTSGARAHASLDLVLAVPEPGAAILAALGLAGLTASRRRAR